MQNQQYRVLITSSREFTDSKRIFDFVEKHQDKISLIVTGKTQGAETFVVDAAEKLGIPYLTVPAKWYNNGVMDKGAGLRRNAKMVDNVDRVVAYMSPSSRGTANTIQLAKMKKKEVFIIQFDPATQPKTLKDSLNQEGEKVDFAPKKASNSPVIQDF